ncbi:24396_t:CDS:2, partial [Gigaspora rosea]
TSKEKLVKQTKAKEDRLEEKIEKKLCESLLRVLNKSLQQWTAQLNRSSLIEINFSSKKFKKFRTSMTQETLRLRALILRVAKEEGWNITAKNQNQPL